MSSQVLIEFSPFELLSAKQVIEVSYSTIDTRKEKCRTGVTNVCNRLLVQGEFSSTKYLRCLINIDQSCKEEKNTKCTRKLKWLYKHTLHCSILHKIFSFIKVNPYFIQDLYDRNSWYKTFLKVRKFQNIVYYSQ